MASITIVGRVADALRLTFSVSANVTEETKRNPEEIIIKAKVFLA
ncbi:hypothetical protein ACBO_05940 [Acinetobacter bouvetii]|nr:hypothetical protein ACBO_05940 [Acinetobacter bouvetii]